MITDPVSYLHRMRLANILAVETLALAVLLRALFRLLASQY